MDQILISIITPTYNHEKYIEKCIKSVLAQSYPNWEQIIIDDGSTDNTKNLISNFKDSRIKYIRQDNKGIWRLKEIYNTALKHSKGKIIAILEGDDFWPPYKLENQIKSFNNQDVVLSWGKAIIVDENEDTIGYSPKSMEWIKKKSNDDILKFLLFGNFIPACTVMCRKNTLTDINGFKQINRVPYVDHLTWLNLSLNGELDFVDETLGFWRHHQKQISSNMPLKIYESMEYSISFFKEAYKKNVIANIGLYDLLIYNLNQIKYNILYFLENHRGKNDYGHNGKNMVGKFSLRNLISLLKIFYAIFRVNMAWIGFIIKRYFK